MSQIIPDGKKPLAIVDIGDHTFARIAERYGCRIRRHQIGRYLDSIMICGPVTKKTVFFYPFVFMKTSALSLILAGALCATLGACASTRPAAPSFVVLPAKGKSFEAFQREDEYCQAAAQRSIGYESPGEAANQAAVGSAAVGTALGALAGAAIGSASGNVGAGAAIGAGTGLLAGSVVGSQNARVAGGSVQARYDTVYAQCMSSKGNQIIESMPALSAVYVYPRPYYWHRGHYRY